MVSANQPWDDGPLDLPNRDSVVKDLTCHGVFGLTLREALQELALQPAALSSDQLTSIVDGLPSSSSSSASATVPPAQPTPRLESESISHILSSLGKAIADTQVQRVNAKSPIAGLLKGRIHNYNRRGAKWRFAVENAVLRRRYPLDVNRRRRQGPSLWTVSTEKAPNASVEMGVLEILAYDDKE